MTALAAYSEIVRVGGWSLRGLGYPFGVAERAIRILAWSEAVHGGSVRALRVAQEAIAATTASAPLRRERTSPAAWRIDCGGKHLMEVGPPVIDLLTSDARRHGFGHVALEGAIGHGLVASLADLVARRGLVATAVYRSAPDDVLPKHFPVPGWLVAAPSPDGTVFAHAGPWSEEGPVVAVLLSVTGALHEAAEQSLHADLAACAGTGAQSYVGFSALPADPAMAERLLAAGGAGTAPVVDYSAKLAEGYRSGIPMEAADLVHLYALERITWAPTSERSRSQAGYGRF